MTFILEHTVSMVEIQSDPLKCVFDGEGGSIAVWKVYIVFEIDDLICRKGK